MQRRLPVALALLMLVAFAACASGSARALRDREWQLVSVTGIEALPQGATPMIRFDTDGRFSGNGGCNNLGAAYTVDGDRLTIRPVISTKRACLEGERNRLESAVLRAIENTRRFRIENDQLELLGEDGSVQARFR